MMDFEQIKGLLPQRFPFLMIDRVLETREKRYVTAIKQVTGNEMFFLGHFPNQAVMPGTMIVEGMAQTGIIGWYEKFPKAENPSAQFLLGSVNVKFMNPAFPGDTIRYEVDLVKLTKEGAYAEAKAYADKQLIAEATLIFSVKQ